MCIIRLHDIMLSLMWSMSSTHNFSIICIEKNKGRKYTTGGIWLSGWWNWINIFFWLCVIHQFSKADVTSIYNFVNKKNKFRGTLGFHRFSLEKEQEEKPHGSCPWSLLGGVWMEEVIFLNAALWVSKSTTSACTYRGPVLWWKETYWDPETYQV